jgi:DNA-binding NarL/FixJ family response regulator
MSADMAAVRVLIADDHAFYREGVRGMLRPLTDTFVVIGEASDGEEVVAQARALRPDVILMDLKMPRVNGIEATRQVLAATPEVGILMVTMFEDDDSVFAAMRAGARGYLLKDADREELTLAVRAVARGEAIFSPAIAQRMIRYFAALPQSAAAITFPELTEREREILDLMAQGLSNKVISNRLVLSLKTVQNHVSHVFSKLQVADRAEAIVRAREGGLGGSAR